MAKARSHRLGLSPLWRAGLVVVAVAGGLLGCDDSGPARVPTTRGADPPATSTRALAELPVPRTEVAGTVWRGQLVVAGGITADGGASDLVHVYDASSNSWRPAPSLPRALHHTGLAVLGDRLYVIGGYTNRPGEPWRVQAAVASLGPGEDLWRDEPPLGLGPRGAAAVATAAGGLIVVGGESGGRALDTTEEFEPAQRAWVTGPRLSVAREHLAAATSGGRVLAIAGRTAESGNLSAVESLDPVVEGRWRPEPEVADPRSGIGAAEVAGRVCVAGGEDPARTIASVECFEGGRWRHQARLQRPRHGLAVMALGNRLHVVAGGERPGLAVSGAHEVIDVGA